MSSVWSAGSVPWTSQVMKRNSSGSPRKSPPASAASRSTVASRIPSHNTGRQTRKPASGPATPMSKSARRCGIGLRMRMKAPSVPTRLTPGTGNGMKKGSVTSTP